MKTPSEAIDTLIADGKLDRIPTIFLDWTDRAGKPHTVSFSGIDAAYRADAAVDSLRGRSASAPDGVAGEIRATLGSHTVGLG